MSGSDPIWLADDLTGAGDVGGALLASGQRVIVRIPPDGGSAGAAEPDAAVVVDLETRMSPRATAVRIAARIGRELHRAGLRIGYFKIDSTLRGHPFAEGEALRQASGAPLAWYVPANPDQGRITVGGRQFVHGIRVERSEFARDPLHPVHSGDLIALAGAVVGRAHVAHLNVHDLRRGASHLGTLRRRWLRSGCRAVIADVLTPADLRRLAEAIPASDLPVGAAALAGLLQGGMADAGRSETRPDLIRSGPASKIGTVTLRTLGVIGSLNPTTAEQIRALAKQRGVVVRRLSRSGLSSSRLASPDRAACWIVCLNPASFRSVRPSGVNAIATSLGRFGAAAFGAFRPDRLFLSGGLTALAVCRALGIAELELLGVPSPGITAARGLAGGRSVEILTKPGGFGSVDALRLLAGAAA